MHELHNTVEWATTSKARQDEIVNALVSQLNGFEVADATSYASEAPIRMFSLRERATGIVFLLIPGGTFMMGFDEAQKQALLSLRFQLMEADEQDIFIDESFINNSSFWHPVHAVHLAPFLLARFPLSWSQASQFISLDESNFIYRDYLDGLQVPNAEAAYLSVEAVEALLQVSGHILPSESQWEYASRAGTTTLFFWGNDLSNLYVVENFDEAALSDAASNRFGLVNMGFHGDICADTWHDNYEGAPSDGSPWLSGNRSNGERVVRGGAADSYPWQGCGEWLSMLCAYRSSSDESEELGVNVRLAHVLPML
jgi:formylglycine-generating enzyme required for sulfatase activity